MGPSPTVLMDCTAIPANHGGVARYVHGVLEGYESSDFSLVILAQHSDRERLAASAPWATVITAPRAVRARPLRLLWEQLRLPAVARRAGATVLHSPHYTFPLAWRGRRVVTLHDATFFSHPDVHTTLKGLFFRTWIRAAWRRAHAVIVPSAATAGELDRFLGVPKGQVSVARLGVDSRRFHPPTAQQLSEFRAEHDLQPNDTWFAFLGTIEPRKNVGALLDAYAATRTRLGDDAPRLLIAGARGWDQPALARLDALTSDSGVSMLGYVAIDHLAALLGGSVAVVYPSLGEGFGLPVVEAMACGAMVVTTRHLAIPEVGGDAVVYSDTDAESLDKAMQTVLEDEPMRQDVIKRAIIRAATFNWRATALAHVTAFSGHPYPTILEATGIETGVDGESDESDGTLDLETGP